MATAVATTSRFILDKVGGAANVTGLTHCATRLRFQLDDMSKVDVDGLAENSEILGTIEQGDNGLQVVLGGGVGKYYEELSTLLGAAGEKSDKGWFSKLVGR